MTITDKQADIMQKAAELFAEQGVVSTTVRQIGDLVGMLSGSIYYHFESKEALVDAIISRHLEGLVDRYSRVIAVHTDPRSALEALISTSFDALVQDWAASTIYQNEYAYLRRLERFEYFESRANELERLWLRVIADGRRKKVFRSDIPPRILYRFTRDAIWNSIRWFDPNGKLSIDDIAHAYIASFVEGILIRH